MVKIIIHGDCPIDRAFELHQLFLHHLEKTEEGVEIDLSAVGRCDLSFFQLICAASRQFSAVNKPMRLTSSLPEAVVRQFEKAGFGAACAACDFGECFMKGTDGHPPA